MNHEVDSAEVEAELQNVQVQIAEVEQQLAQIHHEGFQGEHAGADDNIVVAQNNAELFEAEENLIHGLDLNQPPNDQDLDPVIINPVEDDPFGQGYQTQYLLQGQGEVFQLNPQPQHVEQAQEPNLELMLGMQQEHNAPNQPPANPINFLVEEFPPEELMATEEQEANVNCIEEGDLEGNLGVNNAHRVQIQIEGVGPQDQRAMEWPNSIQAQPTSQAGSLKIFGSSININDQVQDQNDAAQTEDHHNDQDQKDKHKEDLAKSQRAVVTPATLNVGQLLPIESDIYGAMVADNFQHNNNISKHIGPGVQGTQVEDGMAWSQTINREIDPADLEANRLWAKYFTSGNSSYIHTAIPGNWANFFIVQLLNPANFNWIRNLLISLAPNLDCPEFGQINFAIPPTCPKHDLQCLADSTMSREIPPKKRSCKRIAPVVVESEVRRSPRI